MKIHISHSTKVLLETRPYTVVERGHIEIKGKGEMKTYFVLHKLDDKGNPIKCKFMEVFENYKNKDHKSPSKANGLDQHGHPRNSNNIASFEMHEADDNPASDDLDFFNDPKNKSQLKGNIFSQNFRNTIDRKWIGKISVCFKFQSYFSLYF